MFQAHLKRMQPYCCWAYRYICHGGQVCLSCCSSLYLSGLIVCKFFYQSLKDVLEIFTYDNWFAFPFALHALDTRGLQMIQSPRWIDFLSLGALPLYLWEYFSPFLPFLFSVLFCLIAGRTKPAFSGLVSSWHIVLYLPTSEFLDYVWNNTQLFFFNFLFVCLVVWQSI